MKANNFKIGNWVDWDDKSIRSKVNGIHPSGNYLHLENGWVNLFHCDPILLSPELFRKAGFSWDSLHDGYVQGNLLIKKIRRKYQVYWHLNQLTSIQYVHELQNLWHSIHHTDLAL